MTPDEYRPRTPRLPRNMTRRERIAARRGTALAQPGGILKDCGCVYTRTGGQWLHITPCDGHRLSPFPLSDESMKKIGAA